LFPKAVASAIAIIRHKVPRIGGAPNVADAIAPAAAPNTASIRTTKMM
jgi:hypothetical protein